MNYVTIKEAFDAASEAKKTFEEMIALASELSISDYNWIEVLAANFCGKTNDREAMTVNDWMVMYMESLFNSDPLKWKDSYANALNNQSYYAILNSMFTEGESYAREGLSLNPEKTEYLVGNLACALLLQGKYEESKQLFLKYKDTIGPLCLSDFKTYRERGIVAKDIEPYLQLIEEYLSSK